MTVFHFSMGLPLEAEWPILTTGAEGFCGVTLVWPLTTLLASLSPMSLTAVTL